VEPGHICYVTQACNRGTVQVNSVYSCRARAWKLGVQCASDRCGGLPVDIARYTNLQLQYKFTYLLYLVNDKTNKYFVGEKLRKSSVSTIGRS